MAPAAFFRVPCTHRIMYTAQCVYRALSERDRRTGGRTGVRRGHRDHREREGKIGGERRELGEEGGKNTVTERKRQRGKKRGEEGDGKSEEQCFEVARFAAGLPLNLYLYTPIYTPFSCALHGFIFILVIEREREKYKHLAQPDENVYRGALMRPECITACATFQHSRVAKWNTR